MTTQYSFTHLTIEMVINYSSGRSNIFAARSMHIPGGVWIASIAKVILFFTQES